MYVDTNCNRQDSEYAEIDDGMNQNGDPTRHHVAKFHHPHSCRYLKQQSRRQQDEQNHRHNHRSPVSTHPAVRRNGNWMSFLVVKAFEDMLNLKREKMVS